MNTSTHRARLLAGTMMIGALVATAGNAQVAAPAPPAPTDATQSNNEGGKIADIVVTAQKRSERAQNVPIAISVLTPATLKTTGVSDTANLGVAVPGLSFQVTSDVAQPFLRGVGTDSIAAGNENNVAIYIDGVYIASPAASIFSLSNIAQLEVLKGPQSTLFGRNATGGVVQIITKTPSERTQADLSVGYGNFKTLEDSFYGTTKVADGAAIDLSIYYKNQMDGWGTNLANGQDVFRTREFTARSKFVAKLGDLTHLTLSADYNYLFTDLNSSYRQIEGQVPLFAPNIPFPGFYNVNLNRQPSNRAKGGGGSVTVDHDLDWAQVVSISSYRHNHTVNYIDQDGSVVPITTIFPDWISRTFTQELQLKSKSASAVQWVAGLYYFDDKVNVPHFDQIDGQAQGAPDGVVQTRTGYQGTRSYAAFGQATAELFANTHLTVGARYTIDKRRILESIANFTPGRGLVLEPGSPAFASKTFKKPTWRISIDHRFSSSVLAFASYNRGFKSGLYNFAPGGPADETANLQPVKPSVLDAFEVGVKSDMFDRHLRVNVSGFYYDYRNMQLSQYVQGGALLLNAASSHIKGIDADVIVVPVERLQLTASASILDARFHSFPGAPSFIVNPPGFGTSPATVDARGNYLQQSPKLTATFTAQYVVPTPAGDVTVSGSLYHNSGVYWSVDNLVRQPSYNLVNASVLWTSPGKAIDFKLWGRNLFNKKYYSFLNQLTPFPVLGSPAEPRTYGFAIGYHFGH